MAKSNARAIKVDQSRHMCLTAKARLSFPQLFTAKAFQDDPNAKKEFKCDLIFDSSKDLQVKVKGAGGKEYTSLQEAVTNAFTDQWGKDKAKWPKSEYPVVRKGDDVTNGDGEVYEGYAGKIYVRPKTGEKYPPRLMLSNGSAAVESDLYAGCYVQAAILVRPYIAGANKGVTLRLVQLRKVADGERFGGFGNDDDMFEAEEMDESDTTNGENESADDDWLNP